MAAGSEAGTAFVHIPASLVVEEVEGLCEAKERGRGSYGAVYEVRVDGVPCIAKRLHDILVGRKGMEPVGDKERTAAISSFRRECNILSGLHHPNVVQFMGVHCGGSDEADISLIMEYMHMDLEHCMKTYPDIPLPYKTSILRDVAYGLAYLHSHKIIHRDLNAGNVLLTESLRAKIADLGVAKLFDRETVMKHTMTVAPGAVDFMPPESTASSPKYDCKLDIFSYGHLVVYLVNQKAPVVADRLVTPNDVKKKQMQVAKRREALDQMSHQLGGSCDPLYSTVVQCLSDTPDKRPTSRDLVKRMEEICYKHPIPYRNSLGPLAALVQQEDEIKSLTDKCLNLEHSMNVSEKVSKARQKDIDILTNQLIIAKFEAQIYRKDFEQERKDREIARGELAAMLSESRQLSQQPMLPTSSNRIQGACSGELEDGNRRSKQRIEDLNVIITRLKSVTQALESQLEEKTKQYDELQQQYKMLELNLQQPDQSVSPQPVVQQPTPQAELPSTTEHHPRNRSNTTPEKMGAYRLPNSQFTTLPRQTTEKLSPHRLRRTHTMEQPSGITDELSRILARRRRWEQSEKKQ